MYLYIKYRIYKPNQQPRGGMSKCEFWDKDKECGLVGKYECSDCGTPICKKHESELMGECDQCEPPRLRKI